MNRTDFHAVLQALDPSIKVYFQPPASIKLEFPCIIYKRADIDAQHADDMPYILSDVYTVTVMTKDPDSTLPKAVAGLKGSRFDRYFPAESLHHNVFNIHV